MKVYERRNRHKECGGYVINRMTDIVVLYVGIRFGI